MKQVFISLVCILCLVSCHAPATSDKTKTSDSKSLNPKPSNWELPHLPKVHEAQIRKVFPGSMRVCEFSAIIMHYLNLKYKIPSDKVLMGVSTCVDDIIYTKDLHANPNIKGVFHLGGLSGLPFTGVTGLKALAHHIPEGGTMLLLLEPHIGYSNEKGWGFITRYDQHEPSTCCGALMGTLSKLKANELTGKIDEADYQAGKIAQLALRYQKEILSASNPLVELTKTVARQAEKQIRDHVLEVDMKHMNYIVILSGILINTDYEFSDYQVIKHIVIYNVKTKSFTEEILIP